MGRTVRPTALVAVLAAAALALASCTAGTQDPPGPTANPRPSASPTGARPTEVPPELIDCHTPATDSTDLPADVTGQDLAPPPGFTRSTAFYQIDPIAQPVRDTYFQAPSGGLNVIAVVLYPQIQLPVDQCDRADTAAVTQFLSDYLAGISGSVVDALELREIAGAPAWVATLSYPSRGFTVVNHWFLDPDSALVISCQTASAPAEIEAGCADVLGQLRF